MARIVGVFEEDFAATPLLRDPVALVHGFTAQLGRTLVVHDDETIVYLGLGGKENWCPEQGHRSFQGLTNLHLGQDSCDPSALVTTLGAVTDVESARVIVDIGLAIAVPGRPAVSAGSLIAAAVNRAKLWTNAAPATLNPTSFVAIAEQTALDSGLSCSVLRGDELLDHGFGAIHGMGSGSSHPSALIDLRYEPTEPTGRVTLVGKGVTFDTGGLSIKNSTAIAGMRQDKCGAATVLAVMSVLRELDVTVAVRAILPIIENMIGPNSLRPGDVVTAYNGTRIQVMDTDFEGRVILADALAYASSEGTGLIVDIATLTLQVVTALGPAIGGLFARNDQTAATLARAAHRAGEPMWRLPYDKRYLDQVLTPTGVKNHPENDSGRAITAALFLGQFVPADIPWAHLDITGPAWTGPASAEGATGFGVRTLLELLRNKDSEFNPRSPQSGRAR